MIIIQFALLLTFVVILIRVGKCEVTYAFGDTIDDQQLGAVWVGEQRITVSLGGAISFLNPSQASAPSKVCT